jgi:5-methylcytosine-specific restriction endonuclease McrA
MDQRFYAKNPSRYRMRNRRRRASKNSQLGLWHEFESQIEPLLFRAQEGRCFYCGDNLDWQNRQECHLEHLIPLSRGGQHGIDNWAIACQGCNGKKGSKTAQEFTSAEP